MQRFFQPAGTRQGTGSLLPARWTARDTCSRRRGGLKRGDIQKPAALHHTASDIVYSATAENMDTAMVDAFHALLSSDAVTHFSTSMYERLGGEGLSGLEEVHLRTASDVMAGIDLASLTDAVAATAPCATASAAHSCSISGMALASLPSVHDLLLLGTFSNAADAVTAITDASTALGQRFAHMQTLDAGAADTLALSLGSLLSSLQQTLEAEALESAQGGITLLSLSLQQLVWAMQGGISAESAFAGMNLSQFTDAAARGSGSVGLSGLVKMAIVAIGLISVSVPGKDYDTRAANGGQATMDLPERYNAEDLQEYFASRPVKVLQRQAYVASKVSLFFTTIFLDARTGNWEKNMPKRAIWLRTIAEGLGPAYVKIAQALSTRVDMFPDTYLHELAKLQDSVPTFPTEEARALIESELGTPISEVFVEFSPLPVASASLGQVYKGKLKPIYGGAEVAIKVQRPGVLERIALDVLLMKQSTSLLTLLPMYADSWCEVLDDWAGRFFQEMDYQQEAYNMITFKRQVESLEGIVVADVYPELTTRRVIVTGWVVGEKLSNCKGEDVLSLCDTLLNCYLIQLLETGLLHADPHPGNLLRTPEGKICILDFGLMSEVDPDQRIHLVEYITHLMHEDWGGVTRDLVALGFLPPTMTFENVEDVKPVIEEVMGQLVQGGGTAGISIGNVSMQLEGVAREFKMVIPPYFALILRAFSVIEGIALKHDPEYAIVSRCFPYLSRRLLTDNDPRVRAALKQLLYGNSQRLNVPQLEKLMAAFSTFTVASSGKSAQGPTFSDAAMYEERVKGRRAPADVVLDANMKEALLVVFSKDGSYAQELVVDEMVAAVDALSREALGEALRLALNSSAAVTTLRSMEALWPLHAMMVPMPMPHDMLTAMNSRVTLTEEDRQALHTIEGLLHMVSGAAEPRGAADVGSLMSSMGSTLRTGRTVMRGAGDLIPIMPDLLPGVQATFEMFVKQLVRRMALRLAEDLAPSEARL